jgi:iduronate 2-sulfatase
VDQNVGRVLAELDRLNLRTNTIVVFWGDHGYQLGERGKWSKAGSLFEQGARVPFLICHPDATGNGQGCERVVESLDFYPTLVELCGLPTPPDLEGRSLVTLLQNPRANWDHAGFTVWSENGKTLRGVAVHKDHWRYAEFEDGSAMLFDQDQDPEELKNVADDLKNAGVRATLSKLVKDYWAGFKPLTNAAPDSVNRTARSQSAATGFSSPAPFGARSAPLPCRGCASCSGNALWPAARFPAAAPRG